MIKMRSKGVLRFSISDLVDRHLQHKSCAEAWHHSALVQFLDFWFVHDIDVTVAARIILLPVLNFC